MQITALACLALLIVLPATAGPQVRIVRYDDDRLAGIRAVDALVTFETPAGTPCSPRKGDLQRTVVGTLREAGVLTTLSERARSTPYSLETRVRSAAIGPYCATAISSELIAEVDGLPESDKAAAPGTWGSLLVGTMSLVREEALVTTAQEAHDAAVQRAVRSHVQAIAERVRRANP